VNDLEKWEKVKRPINEVNGDLEKSRVKWKKKEFWIYNKRPG